MKLYFLPQFSVGQTVAILGDKNQLTLTKILSIELSGDYWTYKLEGQKYIFGDSDMKAIPLNECRIGVENGKIKFE